jgi:hypothetical protein
MRKATSFVFVVLVAVIVTHTAIIPSQNLKTLQGIIDSPLILLKRDGIDSVGELARVTLRIKVLGNAYTTIKASKRIKELEAIFIEYRDKGDLKTASLAYDAAIRVANRESRLTLKRLPLFFVPRKCFHLPYRVLQSW